MSDSPNLQNEQTLGFYREELTANKFRFFIDQDIVEPSYYRELIQCCASATENDIIEIFINSGGGRLDSCMAIVSAIRSCEGLVVGIINGHAYSAAGMIALSCHQVVVTEFSQFMAHYASYGSYGKGGDIKKHVDFSERTLNKILHDVYEGFYTAQEIDRIIEGHDDWLDSDQIIERLEKRSEYFQSKEKEIEEIEEPTPKPKRKPKKSC